MQIDEKTIYDRSLDAAILLGNTLKNVTASQKQFFIAALQRELANACRGKWTTSPAENPPPTVRVYVQSDHVNEINVAADEAGIGNALSEKFPAAVNGVAITMDGVALLRLDGDQGLIRNAIMSYIGDEFSAQGGVVKVEALGDRWVRITITIPRSLGEDEAMNLALDLDADLTGKGWYDVRDKREEDGGWVRKFVVRHRGGPMI